MKKKWKVFIIVCASFAGIGMLLCCIAFTFGFRWSNIPVNGSFFAIWDDEDSHSNMEYGNNEQQFSDIEEVEIEVSNVELSVEVYDGDTVKVEADVVKKLGFGCIQDGEELTIRTKTNRVINSEGTIKVYIPNKNLKKVDVFLGAGEAVVTKLQAEEFNIEVGAGSVEVQDFVTKELSVQCGAGELLLSGDTKKDVNIECGIGSIEYTARGSYEDYNYSVESGIGNINIDDNLNSGIVGEKKVDNHASKQMDIECGVGSISVSFE